MWVSKVLVGSVQFELPVLVDTATDLFAIHASDCTLCTDIIDRANSEDNDILGGA